MIVKEKRIKRNIIKIFQYKFMRIIWGLKLSAALFAAFIILIFTLVLLIFFVSPCFAHNGDKCFMPPFDEKNMKKYAAFVDKKKSEKYDLTRGPHRSFSESRPYEGLRPAVGRHKTLAFLVDFDDRPYYMVEPARRAAAYYNDILFNETRASMNRYYKQASRGMLSFCGELACIGASPANADSFWYRSRRTYAEWGNDPQAFEVIDSPDISSLAFEVIENASHYIDFSSYDTDRDGIVSPYELHIIIFHSASGQERTGYSGDIWSHRCVLESPVESNGVMVDSYVMLAHDSPLGVLCHEVGHDLGLFDIYDTYTGGSVLGSWTLMDRGAWNGAFPKQPGDTPALLTVYEKMMLGWVEAKVICAARDELYLKCASSMSNITKLNGFDAVDAVKIEVPGSGGKQYLLFENRYKMPDSFDEGIPPGFKRNNGVLVYYVDETMPDKTAYQYANDSRNSFYRIAFAPPVKGGLDSSFYTDEFSRYSSKLKIFHNGVENNYRMNCSGENGEFVKLLFNSPVAHFNTCEVSISGGDVILNASLSDYNSSFTSVSAYIFQKLPVSGDDERYYSVSSEIPIFENETLFSPNIFKKVSLKNILQLNSSGYFVRLMLKDGLYEEEKIFGPFTVSGLSDKFVKVYPAAVNKGIVNIDVYLSENAPFDEIDTEEVYYSYIDSSGIFTRKRIKEYTAGRAPRKYRSYNFLAGNDVASDITVNVVSANLDNGGATFEVKLEREALNVSHGVYMSALAEDNITIMAESGRELMQAGLSIFESGRGTLSVSMYSRGGVSGADYVYYYNYRTSGNSIISYELKCVDRAGNEFISASPSVIYKFPLTRHNAFMNYEGGTIEIAFLNPPVSSEGRSAYINLSAASEGPFCFKIMPEEYNYYMQANAAEAMKVLVKPDFKNKNYVLRSKSLKKDAAVFKNGYYELPAFGEYEMYEIDSFNSASPVSQGKFTSVAAPNPARSLVKFMVINSARADLWPLELKIYDSQMRLLESVKDYYGGSLSVAGYANGVYYYSLDGGGSKIVSKFAVRK